MIQEVPYDPHLYFLGEEISLAVRLWTHGWDLFNPNRVVAYHNYNQDTGRTRHWQDVQSWTALNQRSISRLRRLFGLVGEKASEHLLADSSGDVFDDDLGRYGLGLHRSLTEYEAASGLNFQRRTWRGNALCVADAEAKTDGTPCETAVACDSPGVGVSVSATGHSGNMNRFDFDTGHPLTVQIETINV